MVEYEKQAERRIIMDLLKKVFPFSFKAKDLGKFIVSLLIYIVIGVVGGLVIGLLAKIPVIGLLAGILGALLDLYGLIGIVLAILVFVKVVK